jgi:hypothetical protein
MENPCLNDNFVDAAALRRYNFFKGLILVLLAALLLGLWGFTRQFASIQAPTLAGPDGVVAPGTVTLNGRGSPNSDINVQMNGRSLGTTTVNADGSWSLDTDLAAGEYDFIALALDSDGLERGRSAGLTLNVTEPLVFTAPTLALPGGEVNTAAVPFSGTGTPGSRVDLFNNGVSLGTAVVDSNGQWTVTAPINRAINDLQAFGFDPGGAAIGDSGLQRLFLPSAAASLTLNAPDLGEFNLDDAGLSQSTIRLTGTGEPFTQVRLALGGLDLSTVDVDADGNWSFDGDFALEAGTYDLQARMATSDGTDLGTAVAAGLVVPAVGTAPTLVVDAADDGLTWHGTALASSTVEIVVNGEVAGTAVAGTDGNWSWTPDLELGAYEVTVRAADDPDLSSDVQTARVGQPVAIDAANVVDAGNGTGELTLRGTAVANSQIQILINGEVVDTVTADAAGIWTYAASLPNGRYAVNGRYLDLSEAQAEQMAAVQTVTVGQPTGALQLLFAGVSQAGQQGTAPAGSPAVEIILDASGSMMELLGDDTRFEAARAALQAITDNVLPDGAPIAVRVFGNIEGDYSCRTDLMIPYQPLDREAMNAFLTEVEPQFNANTSIADSLARVPFDLADAGDLERIVVLLTDGQETCGGDPAAQIQTLRDSGIDVQVNIVGLAIADDALKAEFERWAEIGGGQYFDVTDPGRLAGMLGEVVLVPYVVRNEAGEVVTIGRVGGRAQTLPVGTYEVEVRIVPAVTFEMVEIVEGETVQLSLDE